MTIRIVTDSACDLSDEELAQWGIGMVPLSIRFGDEEFTDRTQLSTDEFYRRLGASEVLPETAAPSPGAFVEMFNAMQAEGATGVVCINLSEALSATIQAARTAASSDDVTIDVRVVNSKQLTGGLGSIVLAAAAAAILGVADRLRAYGSAARFFGRAMPVAVGCSPSFCTLSPFQNACLRASGSLIQSSSQCHWDVQCTTRSSSNPGRTSAACTERRQKPPVLFLRPQLARLRDGV